MIDKKIKEEFKNLRNSFNMHAVKQVENSYYFDDILIDDGNSIVWEGDNFITVKYTSRNSISRVLSNLYPMSFTFRHKKVASIESVLQGIKYKDKKTQNKVFKYAGVDAYHTRACNSFDFWGNDGKLYWQGKVINRKEEEYQDFLDELYLSVFENPLYFRALIASGNKYLLHHIGRTDNNETVLTRYEYESRLYALQKLASKYKECKKYNKTLNK